MAKSPLPSHHLSRHPPLPSLSPFGATRDQFGDHRGSSTPIGRLLGSLSALSATNLGAIAIREALARSDIPAKDVDAVIMGNVVQAGVGPNPARQAAVKGGIGFEVPATTLNKLCLLGLSAVAYADQLIRLGRRVRVDDHPHLLLIDRKGTKYGPGRMVDALDQDPLTCAFDGVSMGAATELYQAKFGLTRQAQDEFAALSHERAATAAKEGRFDDEIVAVTNVKGDLLLALDESVRPDSTAGAARPAAPGILQRRDDHRWQRLRAVRRRRRRCGHEQGLGSAGWLDLAGRDRRPWHRRRAGPLIGHSAGERHSGRSSSQRSTHGADLDLLEINEAFAASPSPRSLSSASGSTASTSTAAPSRSVTPSP